MSLSDFPLPHILEPTSTSHTHTVIFLHGRSSGGEELADSISEAQLSESNTSTLFSRFPGIRWVFPTAKQSYSTVFQEEMTEWFDIYSLTNPFEKEELQYGGLRDSIMHVQNIVSAELDRVNGDAQKIILAGISQGEAVALLVLLLSRHILGGFMGFSGWMPLAKHIEETSSLPEVPNLLAKTIDFPHDGTANTSNSQDTPIFLGHGSDDAYVDVGLGSQVRDILRKLGYSVEWNEYEGAEEEGHWLKEPEEFDDLASFIERIQTARTQKDVLLNQTSISYENFLRTSVS